MTANGWRELGARCGLLPVLLLLLSACSAVDVETHPAAGFAPAQYRTLSWASPPLDARSDADLRALEDDLRRVVVRELDRRGYRFADAGATADLAVDYRWSRRVEPRGRGSMSPADEMARAIDLDPTPAGDSALHRHPVVDVAERVALRVSFRDVATRELVWWGSASTVAPREGEQETRELVGRLVERLLRELPAR